MRIAIETLGCKANRYDSVALEEALLKDAHKIVSSSEEADVYVINSCTVTKSADAQTRHLIRRHQKSNQDAIVVVTGCSAQINPNVYSSMQGVHFVVGSDLKSEIPRLIDGIKGIKETKTKSVYVDVSRKKYSGFATIPIKRYGDWSRAFIKVQDGCDNFCTFCIIPYSRGRSRSQKIEDVINQINVLVREGYLEVVITGIDLMTYGKGLSGDITIVDLVEQILEKTNLPRLRISSIEPSDITDRLISIASTEQRLCPHFHLSIQSCNNEVLKNMKRRYGVGSIKNTFDTISQKLPNAFIGVDMISGFSGETEQAQKETYNILSNNPWSELHVFPYSEREGTAGVYLKDKVPNQIRFDRAKELRELSESRFSEFQHRWLGKRVKVLPEKYNESDGSFHRTITREYLSILVPFGTVERKREYEVEVTSLDNCLLKGSVTS